MNSRQDASRGVSSLEPLFKRLQIFPKNLSLFLEAFTHRSFLNETNQSIPSNERLEFFGDSVLGLAVSQYLFEKFPKMNEGKLAKRKASLVSEAVLAGWARQLDLGPLIRFGKGEEKTGGREKEALLADCFEALLGALYLSEGMPAVRRLTDVLLESMAIGQEALTQAGDPKSCLQEWAQRHYKRPPSYQILAAQGPDHEKIFEVEVQVDGRILATGRGKSKKEAEQNAALQALKNLDGKI